MQPTQLYLDTARLGRMTPLAQQAHLDFARLAGEEGGSLFFERFLQSGADAWSAESQARYAGLAGWRGVSALKESLRMLAGSPTDLPVLLANRSVELMRLAARLQFQSCRNVLLIDIGWPPYHDLLVAEAVRSGRSLTTVPIRDLVMPGQATADEILDVVRSHYLKQRCDGLFVTAVSHLGVRLPVERLVRSLESVSEPRFVVIDGAQEFAHVSVDLRNDYCDLYLAGCHKWLQAYHPMGLGFYGRRRSRFIIETTLRDLMASGELNDPLLRFSTQLESDALDSRMETVSLGCLFSCQGAVTDSLQGKYLPSQCLPQRLECLNAAAEIAAETGWMPLLPPRIFRTGILLLQARPEKKDSSARELRQAFSDHGIAITAYDGGAVRLSMPADGWRPGELEHLRVALRSAA